MQHWTNIDISGPKPSSRQDHAMCYIPNTCSQQNHSLLMVIGGDSGTKLGDVWLLDLDMWVWSKVCMFHLI